jgi:hypothetical protein
MGSAHYYQWWCAQAVRTLAVLRRSLYWRIRRLSEDREITMIRRGIVSTGVSTNRTELAGAPAAQSARLYGWHSGLRKFCDKGNQR